MLSFTELGIALLVCLQESLTQITPRLPDLTPLPSGFQWCKRGECVSHRTYQKFHQMASLRFPGTDAYWETHMGLWGPRKIFIMLSPNPPPNQGKRYYEFELTAYNEEIPRVFRRRVIWKFGDGEPMAIINPIQGPTQFDLTDKEFRPFWIRIEKDSGGKWQNFSLGAEDRIIMQYHDIDNIIDINYISFASTEGYQAKIFFNCPRTSESRFLPRNILDNLGRIHTPTCNKCDRCPQVYFPVCASDHKTYRNECMFHCQYVAPYKILYKGTCMHWVWQL